jgi:hypothetical protein
MNKDFCLFVVVLMTRQLPSLLARQIFVAKPPASVVPHYMWHISTKQTWKYLPAQATSTSDQ